MKKWFDTSQKINMLQKIDAEKLVHSVANSWTDVDHPFPSVQLKPLRRRSVRPSEAAARLDRSRTAKKGNFASSAAI